MQMCNIVTVLRCFALMIVAGTATGCMTTESPAQTVATANVVHWQDFYTYDGVQRETVFEPEEIYTLPEAEKAAFLEWYNAPHNQTTEPHYRLATYLERTLHGFTYNGNTNTAEQAAILDNGNCLSLAVITAALASEAKLNLKFQKMNSPPVYKKQGDIMMLSSHVRTKAYNRVKPKKHENGDTNKILLPAAVVIDYFPDYDNVKGDYVSKDAVSAMFYRNKVAVALIENNNSKAFWLADKALKLAPQDPENVSAMAIVLRRLDKVDEAERLYEQALANEITDITLLSNYLTLLKQQGRNGEAEVVAQHLSQQNDANPYAWIGLAREYIAKRNFTKATVFLNKAKELAPYLDDVYRELARSYFLQNKLDEAQVALTKAHELAWDDQSRTLYAAKKAALETLH